MVTMAMAAILKFSVQFHRKRFNGLRNRKFKFRCLEIHVVSMATAILEVVYVAKAPAHHGYHLCEV
jgi:uncharacterized membrane protein